MREELDLDYFTNQHMGCKEVVFHATSYFNVDGIWKNGIQQCNVDSPMKAKILREMGVPSCHSYGSLTLKEAIEDWHTDRAPSAIAVICIDPKDAFVSEDLESPKHSLHTWDEQNHEHYKERLIPLQEYNRKQLHYELPEIILPVIPKENVIGFLDVRFNVVKSLTEQDMQDYYELKGWDKVAVG